MTDPSAVDPTPTFSQPRRPRIGISTTIGQEISGPLPGYPRINLASDYPEVVLATGGLPVLLALHDPDDYPGLAAEQVADIDALMLTGGHDVDPSSYHESTRAGCGETLVWRDRWELALIEAALHRGLPILGICRGMQVLNVSFGGTLVQDLPTERPGGVSHWQTLPPDQVSHGVVLAADGLLSAVFSADQIEVTSFHHQGVDRLGEHLVVEATAADGLIEAFRHESSAFVLGVQWHPEMSHRVDPQGVALVRALVEAATRP